MEFKINNDLLDLYFKGMLNSDTKRQIIELITFLKTGREKNVSLYIESEDILKLKEFSSNIVNCLKN